MSDNHVLAETAHGVTTLTMNRPDKRNALTVAMYDRLVAELGKASADPAVRVVVLRGAGGHFTSGNDLVDFVNVPPAGDDSPVMQFLLALVRMEKPVLAAVQGSAIGIGVTMLLHCDMVWADTTAKFRMPFVTLGLCPEGASSLLLPRMMGHARAAELLMFGDAFDGATAREAGLVTGVMPSDTLLDEVDARARRLAALAPSSVRATKELLRRGTRDAVARALLLTNRPSVDGRGAAECAP